MATGVYYVDYLPRRFVREVTGYRRSLHIVFRDVGEARCYLAQHRNCYKVKAPEGLEDLYPDDYADPFDTHGHGANYVTLDVAEATEQEGEAPQRFAKARSSVD